MMRGEILKRVSMRAGGKYRETLGLSRSVDMEGVLREWPDFEFMDGSLGPMSKSVAKHVRKVEGMNERAKALLEEMVGQ